MEGNGSLELGGLDLLLQTLVFTLAQDVGVSLRNEWVHGMQQTRRNMKLVESTVLPVRE